MSWVYYGFDEPGRPFASELQNIWINSALVRLLVDEVWSVGNEAFQQKFGDRARCLDRRKVLPNRVTAMVVDSHEESVE